MDCKEIIRGFLLISKFDGLFNANAGCGCEIDDLIPCDGECASCEPGYKVPCDGIDCDCGTDTGWHIAREKEAQQEPDAIEILGA